MNDNDITHFTPTIAEAVKLFNEMYINAQKFYTKGTATAAARNRKAWSELIKLGKKARKEIQQDKKASVAKKRAIKATKV